LGWIGYEIGARQNKLKVKSEKLKVAVKKISFADISSRQLAGTN